MAKVEDKNVRFRRMLPSVVLWLAAVILYAAGAYYAVLHGMPWTQEITYLIKSVWFVAGAAEPYTAGDATVSMPLYFFQLGVWQDLAGVGHIPGRALSVALGALSAVLLFVICRKLTANTMVASAAAFIFLATPATSYYFATATPAATIALVHLIAVWLIVSGLGRPRIWASVLIGILFTALFFYNQSTIVAAIVLAPLYVLAAGRQRILHAALMIAATAASAAALIAVFPQKMIQYALRLPGLAEPFGKAGLGSTNFTLIDNGTVNPPSLGLAFDQLDWTALLDGFLLPYAGTILFALLLFRFGQKGLRVLWIAPLYFLWLGAAHFIALAGICESCLVSYAPHFAAVGALAAALTLAMMSLWARQNGVPAAALVLVGAVIIAGGNALAPALALNEDMKLFPLANLSLDQSTSEPDKIGTLAQWIAAHTSPGEQALVIHGIGADPLPALPYAAFLAGHKMPPQSINLPESYRMLKPDLSPAAREAVQAAVEEESLWTDATLRRWINRDYDLILMQESKTMDQSARLIRINSYFNHIATTTYEGQRIFLYERRPAQ